MHKDIISLSLDDDSILKHMPNIKAIVESKTTLAELKTWEPAVAGGFPMSLLFAPRETDTLKISRGYYHDYDLYFKDENNLLQAKEKLIELGGDVAIDTQNATTIKVNKTEYQLIKIYMEEPIDIIAHYDFVNCACGLTLHNNKIHFHKESLRWHLRGELQILDPWMLTQLTGNQEDITNNIVIQLLRFAKYCARWNYRISEDSLGLLLKIYHQYPEIKIRDQIYVPISEPNQEGPRPTSSWASYLSIGRPNQNVWEAMAVYITNAYGWNPDLDLIGIIKSRQPQPLPEDLGF